MLVGALLCPVCFGASDAPMAQAMNWGVLTLLAITVAVLASFGVFFVRIARRSRLARGPAEAGPYGNEAGPYGNEVVGAGFSRPDCPAGERS
jgi:hypothetical protein